LANPKILGNKFFASFQRRENMNLCEEKNGLLIEAIEQKKRPPGEVFK